MKKEIYYWGWLWHSVLRLAMIWIKCPREYCLRPNRFAVQAKIRNYIDRYYEFGVRTQGFMAGGGGWYCR